MCTEAKAASKGTLYMGIAALVVASGVMIGKELMPG